MKPYLFFVLLGLFVLLGCNHEKLVCRDRMTYIAEFGFFEHATVRSVSVLEKFVQRDCRCENGKFMTPQCEEAARLITVITVRLPWHRDMALYNAGIIKERPSKTPPLIPAPETLCIPIGDNE